MAIMAQKRVWAEVAQKYASKYVPFSIHANRAQKALTKGRTYPYNSKNNMSIKTEWRKKMEKRDRRRQRGGGGKRKETFTLHLLSVSLIFALSLTSIFFCVLGGRRRGRAERREDRKIFIHVDVVAGVMYVHMYVYVPVYHGSLFFVCFCCLFALLSFFCIALSLYRSKMIFGSPHSAMGYPLLSLHCCSHKSTYEWYAVAV